MYLCPLAEMTDTSNKSIATRSNLPDTGTCPIGWCQFTGDLRAMHLWHAVILSLMKSDIPGQK